MTTPATSAPAIQLPSNRSTSRAVTLAVLAITAAGAFLCLHNLGLHPLWFDEGWSYGCTRLSWHDSAALGITEPVQWPYYLVLRAWILLGDSEAMIRMPSALFLIASIPVMFAVARRLYGAAAGLVCAALFATNSDVVKYAHEARSYGMETFLLLVAFYCLIRYVDTRSRLAQIGYIAICAVAIYTHIYGVFVIAAQGLSLPVLFPSGLAKKQWFLTYFSIGILGIPMWLFAARMPRVFTDAFPMPTWDVVHTVLQHVCGNSSTLVLLYFGTFAAAFGILFRAVHMGMDGRKLWAALLPILWAALPFVVTITASHLGRPSFLGRYMMFTIPGIVLTMGLVVRQLPRPGMAVVLLLVVVPLHIMGVRFYYERDYDHGVEDYSALAKLVAENAQPGDGIALFWPGMHVLYDYYLRRLPPTFPPPQLLYPERDARANFQLVFDRPDRPRLSLRGVKRVWLVLHSASANADNEVILDFTEPFEREYRLTETYNFPSWTVMLYGRPSQASGGEDSVQP